jgi:hypothetical protein
MLRKGNVLMSLNSTANVSVVVLDLAAEFAPTGHNK